MSEISHAFISMLTSHNKRNKLFTNVLLLITDSHPSERANIVNELIGVLGQCRDDAERTRMVLEFIGRLVVHDAEYKRLFVEAECDFRSMGRDGVRVYELVNDVQLAMPPELFLYGLRSKEEYLNDGVLALKDLYRMLERRIRKSRENVCDTANADSRPGKGVKRVRKDVMNNVNSVVENAAGKFAVIFHSLQCRMCALRFSDKRVAAYQMHLEDHNRRRRSEESKDILSRTFFPNEDHWLSKKIELPVTKQDTKKIIVSKKLIKCSMCGERMRVDWDDDDDGWVVMDGIKLGEDDEYVHRDCAF